MEKDIEERTFEDKFVGALMSQINVDTYNTLIKHCIKASLASRISIEENMQLKTDVDELIHTNLNVLDLLLSIDQERVTPSTFKDYQLEKQFKMELVAKELGKKKLASIILNHK